MMNNTPIMKRKGVILSATFLLSIFLIFSCKKKESSLGLNSIDQNELLSSSGVDTFSLTTYSFIEDSIISDNMSAVMIGSYNDPVFGSFNSEIYTQIRMEAAGFDFGDPSLIAIDSLVLGLEYLGSYGDNGIQTIEVYELGEDLSIDSTYYSFQSKSLATNTDLVVNGMGAIELDPSYITVIGNDTVNSQIRIPIDTNLGVAFLNEAATGSAFIDNVSFQSYFKGLLIKTNNGSQASGTGGIFYVNLSDPQSKLTMYYKLDGVPKEFDFTITSSDADFNHVDLDASLTSVETVVNDTISGQNEFYAQCFGTKAVIECNGLNNIPANAVIHKASLILPISYQTGSSYAPSLNIAVATRLEEGSEDIFNINVIGSYSNFSKGYTFDLRNYIQAITNNDLTNNGLIFYLGRTADRVIFNGPNSTNKEQPKLSILYSEF